MRCSRTMPYFFLLGTRPSAVLQQDAQWRLFGQYGHACFAGAGALGQRWRNCAQPCNEGHAFARMKKGLVSREYQGQGMPFSITPIHPLGPGSQSGSCSTLYLLEEMGKIRVGMLINVAWPCLLLPCCCPNHAHKGVDVCHCGVCRLTACVACKLVLACVLSSGF